MERVIKLPGNRRLYLDRLQREDPAKYEAALKWLNDVWIPTVEANPLEAFEPHSPAQAEFLAARTPIVAAFAGNRFGKSTSLVVRALIECLDEAVIPAHLRQFKRFPKANGWIIVPTEDKIFDTFQKAFERWCPPAAFQGGNWGKAFNGSRMELRFANGSTIAFKTYKQDPSTLGGAALHWVGYDEPPPLATRQECMTRLYDFNGYEMFAMTPLKSSPGWIRKKIYKERESPRITVVRGSMHDNTSLAREGMAERLEQYSDVERQAREFGDFVDFGGLVYPDFDRWVVEPFTPADVKDWDEVVVAIDPGIRNAAIIWGGFDRHQVCHVFAERLLQDSTPAEYAKEIRAVNSAWGLRDVSYVIDPAARQRSQVNATTVQTALMEHGIYTENGQNDKEAGIDQMRERGNAGRLKIGRDLVGIRDEADDYATEETDDGSFKIISSWQHRLDGCRYLVMARPWYRELETQAPHRNLGFQPNHAPRMFGGSQQPVPPMGSMS